MPLWPYSMEEEYLARGRPKNVSSLESVTAGLAQRLQNRVTVPVRTVHPGERLNGVLLLLVVLDLGEQPVSLQVADRCNRHALAAQGSGKSTAEVDGGQHVFGLGVHIPHGAAQPPFGSDLSGLGGVPDVHGAEVGAVRVRVAYPVDQGQLAPVPQLFDRRRMGS